MAFQWRQRKRRQWWWWYLALTFQESFLPFDVAGLCGAANEATRYGCRAEKLVDFINFRCFKDLISYHFFSAAHSLNCSKFEQSSAYARSSPFGSEDEINIFACCATYYWLALLILLMHIKSNSIEPHSLVWLLLPFSSNNVTIIEHRIRNDWVINFGLRCVQMERNRFVVAVGIISTR